MRVAPVIASAMAALALGACGSERTLTAGEFVDEMNAHGAALALEPALTTNPDGASVYPVTITEPAPSAVGQKAPPTDVHGSGTLLVVADTETAEEEFDRCEGAPSLTCFRAANAVLRIEDLPAADRARITTALEGMAADGD